MDIIRQNIRPELDKLSDQELVNIIVQNDNDWYKLKNSTNPTNSTKIKRIELVDKIFELWAGYELVDSSEKSKPIECLICCDILTNGNNLTFECGHKFHSICVIKHVMHHSIDIYQNYINDTELTLTQTNIDYSCPQCKKIINSIEIKK